MRIKSFKCQYCGEQIEGEYQFTLAFQAGFIWNPQKFDRPAWYFDFCRACEHTFVKKYLEGQAERKAEIEAEKLRTWTRRFGIDKGITERRKVKAEVPYSRRRGDQISLFTDERRTQTWEQRTAILSGHSLAPALHAVARKRQAAANARNVAHRSKQMVPYFLSQ